MRGGDTHATEYATIRSWSTRKQKTGRTLLKARAREHHPGGTRRVKPTQRSAKGLGFYSATRQMMVAGIESEASMPTIRQKAAALKTSEIIRNPKPGIDQGDILREAGYSTSISERPATVTKSQGFQELMDKYLPNEKLFTVHNRALEAQKIITSHTEPDYQVDDVPTQLRAVELGYKVKRILGPETQVNNQYNGDLNVSFATDEQPPKYKVTSDSI